MPNHMGYNPNPAGVEHWINDEANRHPVFGLAAPGLVAEKKTVLLYEPHHQLYPTWKRGAQQIGSCVGWGWSWGVDIMACVDVLLKGEEETYDNQRVLEASVYGFSRVEVPGVRRAGRGDGSYGAAAARAVVKFGTLHYGVDYGGEEFTDNSGSRERQWGDTGVPDQLEPYAQKHRVNTTSLVTSFDEAAAAISNGYPVPVCSGQGFTQTRDDQGFCRARGRWSHCMLFLGVRHGKRPGLLCGNSWGDSNTGPHYPKTMPDQYKRCSFWVDADDTDKMLRQNDSFAISGYDGFPPRKLDWSAKIKKWSNRTI
jgi:hypothetical protein